MKHIYPYGALFTAGFLIAMEHLTKASLGFWVVFLASLGWPFTWGGIIASFIFQHSGFLS